MFKKCFCLFYVWITGEKFDIMLVKNSLDDELQELQTNNTTGNKLLSLNNEPCVVVAFNYNQQLAKEGKMTSKLQDHSTRYNNLKHKEATPRSSYPKIQLKPNEIAKYISFLVVLSIILVGLFFDTWIEPSLMKDQRGRIWASLIRLFGFMAFVWAVAIMILDGVPFVRLQSIVLIFWAIWMHLKS
jgi:hypothetical protein